MKAPQLDQLAVFAAVAEEKSFTRAAARLGVSQSALSHSIKGLEARLGVQVLARTTRSVAATGAGELLLARLRPALGDIGAAVEAVRQMRATPSGTLRIATGRHAMRSLLRTALSRFLPAYPEVTVEVDVDDAFTDIVASGFDAGIRIGEQVDGDMIAVRIGPDLRPALVASPAYFAGRSKPRAPRDLLQHRCINYRFHSSGGVYAWELDDGSRPLRVRVPGSLIVNEAETMLEAALDGHGIAYFFEDMVAEHLAAGTLVRVLAGYCQPFPGYFLYYSGRRQSPALMALVEMMRHRRGSAGRGHSPKRASPQHA